MPAQDRPDGTWREPDAEPEQFALNAPIAPGRVFTRQPHHESEIRLSVLGRPTVRREYVQRWVTSSRCQRRSVAGETNSVDHTERGSEWLSAASSSLSVSRRRGRAT